MDLHVIDLKPVLDKAIMRHDVVPFTEEALRGLRSPSKIATHMVFGHHIHLRLVKSPWGAPLLNVRSAREVVRGHIGDAFGVQLMSDVYLHPTLCAELALPIDVIYMIYDDGHVLSAEAQRVV